MKLWNGLALAGLVLAVGTSANAQNREFQGQDYNGDGEISRDEWRGNMRSFYRYDRNGDGVISSREMPAWARNRRASSGEADRSRTAGRLDDNRNGVVEGFEWPYNSDVFHQLDRNGDSVLSQDELNNMSQSTLREVDRNRNGRIDNDEWPGSFAQFDQLDQNSDGRVTSDEYFKRGGEWSRQQRFDAWDRDRDGVVKRSEWQSDSRLFRQLDTDRDGVLSRSEFMGDTGRYVTPYGWR